MVKKIDIQGLNKEYTIDEDGNIFDVKEQKYRKFHVTKDGYLKVSFYINGKFKRLLVHRLVLMMFKPIENMDKLQVNHIDGNKQNNNINNLEWVTQKDNMAHAWKTGLCKNSAPCGNKAHHRKISTEIVSCIRKDLEDGLSYQQIANKYNISKSTVYQIKHSITWK